MSFDLTGLFQRQSNISVTDRNASGVQGAGGANMSLVQSGAGTIQLSVGQIVSGQVIEADGSTVQVEIAPGTVLQAQVEEGLSLLKGMNVSFEVSGVSDKQIALRALFQNTAGTATINKALEAAQLPVTPETSSMVNAMMKEGMPIDKAALQAMFRQVSGHPEVSPQDIVTMNRLEIPVTDANVMQFSDYMNLEHQIRGGVEMIADSMAETLGKLVTDGKVSEAAQFMRHMVDIFMQPEGQGDFGGLSSDSHANALQGAVREAEMIFDPNAKGILQQKSMSLETLMGVVSRNGDGMSGEGVELSARGQRLMAEMENLGFSQDNVRQFLEGQLSGKELLDFANQLLQKMAQSGNGFEQSTLSLFSEFLQKPDMQEAMKTQIFTQWLMTPEDVADKQKVSDFYAKLSQQSGRLAEALKQISGVDQNLMQQTNHIHQNIDFMNQLNQTMSYVQLPLRLAGENAHGDLYVYTNKKNIAKDDGNVSAFLHLDMDHLGPVDVYVAMQQQKVSTQFYLQDEEMLSFIHDHIGLLNERLESKGYQMNAQFTVKEKPGNVMEEIVQDQCESVKIGTFSFDVRA